MKVPLVLLVVAYFTCAANAIILSQEQQNLFKNRCQSLAVHLNDATMRCARALDALLNVENRKSCDFTPVFDALGFVVPGYVGNAHYPLFWSALDGAAGFVDDKGKAINPYTNILRQNANFLTIWSSFNILPGALFNMENFNIIPRFLVDRFCQQYSEWMARNTEANTPSLWMTGGTDNGYFPRPLNGRLPGVFQQYEVPNIESDHVIVFHVPKQIVTGKQCGSDQESYQRLLDTNRHARYACCELSPLIAPGTNTSNVLPLPSADFGRSIFSNMGSILSGISGTNISIGQSLFNAANERNLLSNVRGILSGIGGAILPNYCADLQQHFHEDELVDEVNGAMVGIVEAAEESLLARMFAYGRYRRKRQVLSAAVCDYLKDVLNGIAEEGRLDFSEEGTKLIGERVDGMTVRFTELFSDVDIKLLDGLLVNRITYDCSTMKLTISTEVESLTIIPNILELSTVVLSFDATLGPTRSDLSLHTLEISAQWSVGSITGQFNITDDLDNSQLIIRGGPPGGSDLDLGDLIENLAGEDILGSTYTLSNVQVLAVVNMIKGGTITIVVSGSFEQNTLYGVFQKRRDNSNAPYSAAFAADIDGAEFSELVDRVTGVDISGIPVLGSLSIPDIGITVSTSDIRSPIIMDTFSGDSLLHIGGNYIGSGLTAYFKFVTDQGDVPVFISYVPLSKNFNFEFVGGFVLSFRSFLSLVPDLESLLNSLTLPPGINNLLDIEINDFSVDTESSAIFVDATYPNTLTFFDQLTIDNLNVVINAILKPPKSITVEFSGEIGIANQFFNVDFRQNEETGSYVLDVTITAPPSLNDLLTLIPELGTVQLPPGISELLSLEVTALSADFSTGAVTITASYPDPLSFFDGALTVPEATIVVVAVVKSPRSISLSVTGQVGLGEAIFDISIHRNDQTGIYAFYANSHSPVPLNSLLSLIPGLASLSLPSSVNNLLELTIDDFVVDLGTGALDFVVAYPGSINVLNNLLTVEEVTLTINAVVKSPRSVSITVRGQVSIGGVVFKILFDRNANTGKYSIFATVDHDVTLDSLLSLIPELSSLPLPAGLPLPPGLTRVLDLQINSFSANLDTMEMTMDARYPGALSFFDNTVTVDNPGVIIHAVLKSPRNVSLEIVGDLDISGQDYAISITRDSDTGTYILVADIGNIDISDIIQEFGAAVVPNELNSIVESAGLLKFAINDVHLTYPFGGQPQKFQISGQPEIAGFNGPHISALVIRQGVKNDLVQGFETGSVVISDLIKQISGHDVSSIAILNQEFEAAVLISPVTLPGVRLIGPKLSDVSINTGISFQAAMQWPSDCSADAFCAVAESALGSDARFVLGGTISDAKSFAFTAAVSDLQLGSVVLAEAGLEVRVGIQTEVGIFGTVEINNPALTLTGAIRVGASGVVLEMTMSGCWERAFGVRWLTICSLQVLVALKPGVPLAGFAFGGEVKFGDSSCGTQVQAQGFIGIDPVSPTQNYYYVNIPGEFTIGSILEAMCVNVNLPKPVADSGFPKGFLSSFSLFGKELPHVPLSIPLGYRLKGTINILGLEASADVTANLPDGLKMEVSLPVLKLSGNLLSMFASSNDRSRGPYLIADITLLPQPSVNVEASGYLSVLGISRDALLRITNDAYTFSTEGKFLNLFESNLEITASYGSINSASFSVQGEFKNDLFSLIVNKVRHAMQESADEATAKINEAQQDVNDAKDKFDSANRKLSDAQRRVDSAQSAYDSAVRRLRRAQYNVRRLCTPPTCHDVCIPGYCGTTCKKKKWGKCIVRVPKYSSCCYKAPDASCLAERAACNAARQTAYATLRAAERAVDSSRVTLNAAKAALEGARAAVSAAKHTLDVANAALEAAKVTYKVGAEAAAAITRFVLNDLFNIKEITFNVTLSVASGGSFSGRVLARILGNDVDISLNIDVHDVVSMAKQLADQAISGLSKFVE